MAEHNKLGQLGENIAAKFLQEKGFVITDRNWVFQKHEIDIIALDKDILVFVEVKTRSANPIDEPESAVTITKQRSVIKAANAYIDEKELSNEARFDIISIIAHTNTNEINHIEDAFYPIVK